MEPAGPTVGDPYGPPFLRQHVSDILAFYEPVVMDRGAGGFHNQLLDDGTNYDASTKHVVGTCRFVVNYALAAEMFPARAEAHLAKCAEGLRFLFERQRDAEHGGFFWVVRAAATAAAPAAAAAPAMPAAPVAPAAPESYAFVAADDTKCCYAAAFALLALASARRAGLASLELTAAAAAAAAAAAGGGAGGARTVVPLEELIGDVYQETDRHFFEAGGLCADRFARDWSADADAANAAYRGQNPCMHMCEALLALSALGGAEAPRQLARAATICRRLCHELRPAADAGCAAAADGIVNGVWEHFTAPDWRLDLHFNKDADPESEEYIFRPYGLQPGHLFEWAKLILQLERALLAAAAGGGGGGGGAEAWMLPRAKELFELGVRHGWDGARGGAVYTFGPRGEALDGNKYYWVQAEMIAAAGLLAARCPGEAVYREWYGRAWAYCEEHFIDRERGGWYPMLSADNARVDPHMPAGLRGKGGPAVKSYPSKTDYHPLAACYEVLQVNK